MNGLTVEKYFIGGTAKQYRSKGMAKILKFHNDVTTYDDQFLGEGPQKHKNLTLQVLSANQTPLHRETTANASSLCILLTVVSMERHAHKILFVGDAEKTVEANLCLWNSESIQNCLALKVGHHGSKKACTQDFLNLVSPNFVYVSADMTWSHPYKSTVERILKLPSMNRTMACDPKHSFVYGQGGSKNREYTMINGSSDFFSNIVNIYEDTSSSKKVVMAKKKGYEPVVAEGVRHDLEISLVDGSVTFSNSKQFDGQEITEFYDPPK